MSKRLYIYTLFLCFYSLQAQRQSILKSDEEATSTLEQADISVNGLFINTDLGLTLKN